MKKLFLLSMVSMMAVCAMAIGDNDGTTKANAIDFDWDKGITHDGGTLWYRVLLDPLYEEENPSLTLYLTNPSNEVGTSVDVSMTASVAGQEESKDYTIAARQYKTYTANASMLVRLKQTEIYLTLTSNGKIKLSAKVFESADLDETCKDARTLKWNTLTTQNPMYSAWWRVDLKPVKDAVKKDAKITLTNTGSKKVYLKVGQSLDCPSSGMTKRTYELEPGEFIEDTVPQSMIQNVQPDELYFGVENVESQVSMLVELVDQPLEPIIPAEPAGGFEALHVKDTFVIAAGKHYYRISIPEMRDTAKYEPEFTYRNLGTTAAHVSVKMAFEVPAFGTSNTEYDLAANGGEEIVVYKKNMLEGLDESVAYIYLLTETDQDVNFYGRFKHVREGKACKTNIDFNWESGHTQEGRTTQWYAINVADARDNLKDIIVHLQNLGDASATVKASMAFSCPYIDLQEVSRTIAAKSAPVSRRIGFSSYAMMSDTVWIGLETNQDIKFWATTEDAEKKPEPDEACLKAKEFNWEEGERQLAGDTVWYKIGMDSVRRLKNFPTIFVQNLSATESVKIEGELSVECPDEIENEKRTLTIAANGSYSKQLSRNMFENIVQDTIYLRVIASQEIQIQVRLTEEAEGSSCSSAIPFNWVSGNIQAANANLWYEIDLRDVLKRGNDLKLHIENRENASCKGVAQLAYNCPVEDALSVQEFKLAAKAKKDVTIQNSAIEALHDSLLYINLQSTTSIRFWADTLLVVPFDTITGEGITLIPLEWDSLYTQSVDTAWYVISKEELDKVRYAEDKVKPVAHLFNLDSKKTTIKAEAAFGFPIVKKMMTKSQVLKANQHFSDTVPASTFDQIIKDTTISIIVRVTRPVGSGDFQFQAELVSAWDPSKRSEALPIQLDKQYTQSPYTERWYRLKTEDLKKDKDLFNKALFVSTKNAGKGNAEVTVSVYDGLLSEVDLLEEYGLEDYRKRTIKKGQGKSHNIPAQAVYGLGNVDFYIKVRTTDSLVFTTKFKGTYAPQDVDPNQAKAKLVVPNVDYIIPADTTIWYQICMPYIQNNYQYIHASTLTYELNGKATITATATFQDSMNCAMPVRKRTINKKGGHYKGTKPLWEVLNKGIKKVAGRAFDVSTFQEHFVDSLLHRFVTNDSVTFYVRIHTDKEMKVRLNTPRIKGDSCGRGSMNFDWEHGNVNAAKDTLWLHVKLDSLRVPQGKDLELHMDNWSDGATNVEAIIYQEDCKGEELGSVSKLILKDTVKVIERELLVNWGWSGLQIQYYSDSATHIWAEIVNHLGHDTIFDTIPNKYICPDEYFIDTLGGKHLIDPEDSDSWHFTVMKDSTIKEEAKIVTYSFTYNVYPKAEPALPTIASLGEDIPVVTKGAILNCDAATAELKARFAALKDTFMRVTDIKWEYCVDGLTWNDIPTTALDTAAIALRYTITTECGGDLTSDYWVNKPTYDVYETACNSYYWPRTDKTYTESTTVLSPEIPINAITSKFERLNLTINKSTTGEVNMTVCEASLPITWKGISCPAAGDYQFDTLNVAGCDSTITLHLFTTAATTGEETLTVCEASLPITWKGISCPAAGDYTIDTLNVAGCDSTITLHLFTTAATTGEETLTVCASALPITWKGISCAAAGDYTFDTLNVAGCDSTITLHLFTTAATTGEETLTVCASALPITWKGISCAAAGDYTFDTLNVAGCDSTITLHLFTTAAKTGEENMTVCDSELPVLWKGISCAAAGDYTFDTLTVEGCDSIITLHLNVNATKKMNDTITNCNEYTWELSGITYYESGTYTATGTTVEGCDSIVTLHLTINNAKKFELDAVAKYGNRLLMINRLAINDSTGWNLDSLGANGEAPEVIWWRMETPTSAPVQVGTGYYLVNEANPSVPLVGIYYATIDLPAREGDCGQKGETKKLICGVSASAAPALIPSLARPGEDIRVINLDPDQDTEIRIYTSEGMIQGTYTAHGEETFVIKAAADHGFYLVELRNDNIQSTLRYIVK